MSKLLVPGLLALSLGSGCILFFPDDNAPCTVKGECLANYECVEGTCRKKGAVELGKACLATAECKEGVCADEYCDDSARKSCKNDDECGSSQLACQSGVCSCKRICRKACESPDHAQCGDGLLCWPPLKAGESGFCQEGMCGERSDGSSVGNCLDSEACIEVNGAGSGLCNAMCTVLAQSLECLNPPVAAGVLCCSNNQMCEHAPMLWGSTYNPYGEYGICYDLGTQDEAAPCGATTSQNLFCKRGHFCYSDFDQRCHKYCNMSGGNPACNPSYNCVPFPNVTGLPYGWCQAQ